MGGERENMIFPLRWFNTLKELDDAELRAMLSAIGTYAATGEAPTFKGAMKALWNEMQNRIDADNAKYKETCERRKESAQKRWSKNDQAALSCAVANAKAYHNMQMDANGCKCTNTDAKNADAEGEADADVNISVSKDKSLSTLSPKPGKSGSSGAALKQGKPEKIYFDYEGDSKIHGITSEQLNRWHEMFPAIEVETEIKAASAWLDGNRKQRKTDVRRFLTNWLIRKQDSARKAPDNSSSASRYENNRNKQTGILTAPPKFASNERGL